MGNIDTRGRPVESRRSGEHYALADWLYDNLNTLSGMTNTAIAEELGYERQNMISMMKTGKSRIPLDKLGTIAKLTGVTVTFLLPLWVEQYAGKDGYQEVLVALSGMFSPAEKAIIEVTRKAEGAEQLDPGKIGDQFKKTVMDAVRQEVLRQRAL